MATGDPYIVESRQDQDLERRRAAGFLYDDDLTKRVWFEPQPFGSGDYVGTDPIYQNHSTDQNKPLRSGTGVEADIEAELRAEFDTSSVPSNQKAADPGMGGVAKKAVRSTAARTFRVILPGQAGYDAAAAAAQQGYPLRVYDDVEHPLGLEEDVPRRDGIEQQDNPGTNMGASVTPPPAPEGPGDVPDGGGDKPMTASDDKPSHKGNRK